MKKYTLFWCSFFQIFSDARVAESSWNFWKKRHFLFFSSMQSSSARINVLCANRSFEKINGFCLLDHISGSKTRKVLSAWSPSWFSHKELCPINHKIFFISYPLKRGSLLCASWKFQNVSWNRGSLNNPEKLLKNPERNLFEIREKHASVHANEKQFGDCSIITWFLGKFSGAEQGGILGI